jgi:hypothetical protein
MTTLAKFTATLTKSPAKAAGPMSFGQPPLNFSEPVV